MVNFDAVDFWYGMVWYGIYFPYKKGVQVQFTMSFKMAEFVLLGKC